MHWSMSGNHYKKIACVQYESKMPDFCNMVIMPRYGLPVIGSILDQAGYEVKVFIEHIAEPDKDWIVHADVLLVSSFTGAANRAFEFVDWIRGQKSTMPIILGGEHGSSFAEESLDRVDYVIRGEGDSSILELLQALKKDLPLQNISGLSYRSNGNIQHNPISKAPENIHVVHDLSLIHEYPVEDGFRLFLKRRRVKLICVQATRGCPFRCNFCVAPRLFGYSYRHRNVDAIIEDIRTKLRYGRRFLFTDNLFAIDRKKTNILLDRMIAEGFGETTQFTSFCRVDIYKSPDILDKMYRAGFRYICLGLESIDDEVLHNIDKRQTRQTIIQAVSIIREAGIHVSSSFIAGNEHDTAETPLKIVDFAIEHDINSLHFISLWYYPGDPDCPFPLERMIIPSFDYCTGSFVTHFPMRMRPSTLQRSIVKAQRRFWSLGRAAKCLVSGNLKRALHLASHRYAYTPVEEKQLEYANHLETIEHGYYDSHESLRLDRISTRPLNPIVARASETGLVKFDSVNKI